MPRKLAKAKKLISAYEQKKKGKFRGVSWYKKIKKWRSQINHNNKNFHLGHFDDPVEAAKTYDAKAIELFGSHAILNFPSPRS